MAKVTDQTRGWAETPPLSPPVRTLTGELISSQTWLESLADPIQNWVHTFYGEPGSPINKLKGILNGVWLGHPVHPVLTDIPLGSWTSTLVLDALWLANESDDLAKASDVTLLLGLAGAVGAAATGITDWSDTDGTDRRVGIFHGLLNVGVTATNLISFFLRKSGMRRTGIFLSGIGYMVSLFSAGLGGELSYAKGIGVNHVAFEGGSDDFVSVMDEQDLKASTLTRVDAAGIPAVLYKQGKKIYAIGATCSHLGGPLDEGTCENGVVSCPWHGSAFRLSDGGVVNSPAVYAQPTFAVRVREGKIQLRRLEHA